MSERDLWPRDRATFSPEQTAALAARARSRAQAWAEAQGLSAELNELLALFAPLAGYIAGRANSGGAPHLVGIAGAQGTGKSTAAALLTCLLEAGLGLRCATLSLDDLYLTQAERAELARRVHPLLATRGVPGTHDVALGQRVLGALAAAGPGQRVRLPRFDKARDDRALESEFAEVEGPFDCVLFEGWCVGARPEPEAALARPINALEREQDPDGRLRRFANAQLAGPYRTLFAEIDTLVFLAAPDLQSSLAWRTRQEHELRARHGAGTGMDDAQLARFVQHYERISRHMLQEMPGRADVVLRLDRDHRFSAVDVR
jgi:D-glycerate 3-kinase